MPDYDELMKAIKKDAVDRDSYLYARDEYRDGEEKEEGESESQSEPQTEELPEAQSRPQTEGSGEKTESGYEIPDFLRGLDDADIVKIC